MAGAGVTMNNENRVSHPSDVREARRQLGAAMAATLLAAGAFIGQAGDHLFDQSPAQLANTKSITESLISIKGASDE